MDLLLPSSLIIDEHGTQLHDLLANITGYAVIERITVSKAQSFRSKPEIEAIWDTMCSRLINLLTDTVTKVVDPKPLLLIKELIELFLQTVQVKILL